MPNTPVVNVGFHNYVLAEKIISFVSADSAPVRRMIQTFRKAGSVIDATQGRRTKSVIFTTSNVLILSAVTPETLAKRISTGDDPANEE